jgi:copper homeostasis protein
MTPDKLTLEIAVYSIDAALLAAKAGADRIELCSAPAEGGLTPGIGTIKRCHASVDIPVHVMIRPREGDFLYSETEFETMLYDIDAAMKVGVSGIVCGILDKNGHIDYQRNKKIRELTQGFTLTFNRAFDVSADLSLSLENIIDIGFDLVLTSGGQPTAEQGISKLAALSDQAAGRIRIMPACGINDQNFLEILQQTRVNDMHLSAKKRMNSVMLYRNNSVIMGSTEENTGADYMMPDRTMIDNIRKIMLQNASGQ